MWRGLLTRRDWLFFGPSLITDPRGWRGWLLFFSPAFMLMTMPLWVDAIYSTPAPTQPESNGRVIMTAIFTALLCSIPVALYVMRNARLWKRLLFLPLMTIEVAIVNSLAGSIGYIIGSYWLPVLSDALM